MRTIVKENLKIATDSIRSHAIRTTLTILIIAFGIMALVGILTAIDSIKYFLNENFSMLGANSFSIEYRSMNIQVGGTSYRSKSYRPISLLEATRFKEQYAFRDNTSIYTNATGSATLKYEQEKTNPNIRIIGIDENYVYNSGFEIEKGRDITLLETQQGDNITILGTKLVEQLFKNEDPIGKTIIVANGHYRVVGVLKEKGSSMGFSGDNYCLIPFNNARKYFTRPNMRYNITIRMENENALNDAISEATGLFRTIRGDKIGQEDSFTIEKSDNIARLLITLMSQITIGAVFIGIITLFGAAIGLMNIMLVSVTERTQEIGIRKAMGATKITIRDQFLFEAIVIALLGGIIGIVLGILVGNVMALIIGSTFVIPWIWVVFAVILCFIVAIASGIIPANKAAALDPIEALRYE
ncbi:MAG: ABC transporter permease [Lentimicrobiaceae bacterium]|jgi:putative ABC transport system permease protein|nr:ABC transporter permease [Lentimicrobiaceae bacterium]